MLTIFSTQLLEISTELYLLEQRMSELQTLKSEIESKDTKVQALVEALRNVASELSNDAANSLKQAVLGIFEDNSNGESDSQNFDIELASNMGDYAELKLINPTVGYQRKYDGEIICGYLGTSSKELAKDWKVALELKNIDCEVVRKAKRLVGDDITWEIKLKRVSLPTLEQVARWHPTASTPVPSPKDEPPNPDEAEATQHQPSSESESLNEVLEKLTEQPTNQDNQSSPATDSLPSFEFARPSNYDALCPEWDCYYQGRLLGRVKEKLTGNSYQHSLLKGAEWRSVEFTSREAAAADLLKRRQSEDAAHDRSNKQLQAAYGF